MNDTVPTPPAAGRLARVPGRLGRGLRRAVNEVRSIASFVLHDRGIARRAALRRYRQEAEYRRPYEEAEPLVSVCIATYNRGELVVERAIASVLAQTYTNLEVIVVGDHCVDDTEERMARIRDPRLRFVNLAQRGNYPADPAQRWMVAGSKPMNHALGLAGGHFVTHLDDDDAYTPERIATLVAFLQRTRAELVWHPFEAETADGEWVRNDAPAFRFAAVSTSSVMYHRWFAAILWDPKSYRFEQPGDWNRFKRFKYLGVRAARLDRSLLHHYRERAQRSA
jgi:glycosyltransferase involved in cell wall biosynthesis